MRFTDLSAFTTEQAEETCRRIGVGGKRIGGSAYLLSRASVLFLSKKTKRHNHRSTKRRHADTPTRRYVSAHG